MDNSYQVFLANKKKPPMPPIPKAPKAPKAPKRPKKSRRKIKNQIISVLSVLVLFLLLTLPIYDFYKNIDTPIRYLHNVDKPLWAQSMTVWPGSSRPHSHCEIHFENKVIHAYLFEENGVIFGGHFKAWRKSGGKYSGGGRCRVHNLKTNIVCQWGGWWSGVVDHFSWCKQQNPEFKGRK